MVDGLALHVRTLLKHFKFAEGSATAHLLFHFLGFGFDLGAEAIHLLSEPLTDASHILRCIIENIQQDHVGSVGTFLGLSSLSSEGPDLPKWVILPSSWNHHVHRIVNTAIKHLCPRLAVERLTTLQVAYRVKQPPQERGHTKLP